MRRRGRLRESLRALYAGHRTELFTYALSITGDVALAEDAVHAAFCSVLRRGREPSELRPYIFRCVRNAAIDRRRKDQELPGDSPLFVEETNGQDPTLRLGVLEALEELSEDERESIVLRMYAGLTLNEIAKLREVSINTVASWNRRGMEKLRKVMTEEYYGRDRASAQKTDADAAVEGT